jgi:hypothetical protein
MINAFDAHTSIMVMGFWINRLWKQHWQDAWNPLLHGCAWPQISAYLEAISPDLGAGAIKEDSIASVLAHKLPRAYPST